MTHELKILPEFFQAVKRGDKRFELRKKDRNYQVGDMLILQEWTGGEYTGESIARFITYVYIGKGKYGLAEGYCVLGIDPLPKEVK